MDKKPSTKKDIKDAIGNVLDNVFERIEPDDKPKEQTPTPRMIWNGVPID